MAGSSRRIAPGLSLVALVCLAQAAAGASIADDFTTDPNLSPDWTIYRAAVATSGVVEWDPAGELHLVRYDPSGGPWSGVLASTAPLTSHYWQLDFDMKWDHAGGAPDGGLVVQFYRDMGAYATGVVDCNWGFLRHVSGAISGIDGYGVDLGDMSGCSAGTPHGHLGFPTAHVGIVESDFATHHAGVTTPSHFDSAWHAMSLCFAAGRVRFYQDGDLQIDQTVPGFSYLHDGWGFSASTDSRITITIDDVQMTDRAGSPDPTLCAPSRLCIPSDPSSCGGTCDGDDGACEGTDEDPPSDATGLTPCPRLAVDPPVTAWIAHVGRPVTFDVGVQEATPGEGYLLRLADASPGLPDGAAFDATTGTFAWTPAQPLQDRTILAFEAARPAGRAPCLARAQVVLVPEGAASDRDQDGVADAQDDCVEVPNRDQGDADRDGLGDACDEAGPEPADKTMRATAEQRAGDVDADGVPDAADLCPTVPDPRQEDLDSDHVGDACDLDADGDSVPELGEYADDCPRVADRDQADSDHDGVGDACDAPTTSTRSGGQGRAPGTAGSQAAATPWVLLAAGALAAAAVRRRVD